MRPAFFQSSELCRRAGFAPTSPRRFGYQTFLDRLGADSNVFHLAVNNGLHSLQIGKKPPLGHSRNVRADAALFFGLAAAPNMISLARPLSSQLTNSRHKLPFLFKQKGDFENFGALLQALSPSSLAPNFPIFQNSALPSYRLLRKIRA